MVFDKKYQAELAVSEFSGNGAGILAAANTVVSTFALVFVAEWGDKSFFSTIGNQLRDVCEIFGSRISYLLDIKFSLC